MNLTPKESFPWTLEIPRLYLSLWLTLLQKRRKGIETLWRFCLRSLIVRVTTRLFE
jgi:hypothetical protein